MIVSGVVVALSVVGLYLVNQHEPSPIPAIRATQTGKLSPGLFGTLQTLLTTTLSIGAISLAFEIFLKESYGRELLRFLNLREALVSSGLQQITDARDIAWGPILEGSATIHARLRDPGPWVLPNLTHLIRAGQTRRVTILIGLPDRDGENFDAIATSTGLSPDQLRNNIAAAVDAVTNQWTNNKATIHGGSQIKIVSFQEIALYDEVTADSTTVFGLSRPVNHQVGDPNPSFMFAQDRSQELSRWFLENVSDLEGRNEMWAGQAP